MLILDEPANGLDPAGIRWMRSLLRGYAQRGGTVLLSSHLLHEVEMIADEMVLIGRGRIVAQGTKAELLQTSGTFVRGEHPQKLGAALEEAGIKAVPSGDGGLRAECEPVEVGRVAAASSRGRRTRGAVPGAHRRRRTGGRADRSRHH